ncbi:MULTISPECIES: outer membrane protein [Legionella]|uniref:Porin family protein n=1 Tax=Legionella septentrionalis TaxID=2498109 RepID=A0A3S0VAI9_9GAMM|nr:MULTISPECIES: outer membrane beta-barrel protein [Legionella]MCP0913605.1 outer membrane beta-barrel protein [Legionella sp. 27cVA30]RUQ88208.1 porin family protein [Legionella septentrionalis]RUQ95040.1 porin family protein [Legionella septentrionalis]RUR08800.1 porin family protein [Legionella septentrionalis]RUR15962.1 porin family protein [Legionella septentrionalis]
MRIITASAALFAATLATAATPIDGWYSSVFAGYAYLPDNVSNSFSGLVRNNTIYQSGYDVGGSFGYKGSPLRYEGELTYVNAELKKFNVNGVRQVGVRGYNNVILGMANVFYDFPGIVYDVQPFLGIGIGYAWINAQLNSSGPTSPTRFTASNSAFAYQAAGGLTYNFAENYALNIGYRYVATERVDDLGKIFQAHLANVGVIYRFDEARYK